jgi:hypothetical protein
VSVWKLDCNGGCEDHLRHDQHWAITASEIPETHDETRAREDFERRGAKDKDAVLTLALARLAGIDAAELPESLTRMISGVPAHVPVAGKMVCPQGHENAPGQKFCGECGAPMSSPAAKAAIGGPERPADPPAGEASPSHGGKARPLRDRRLDELQVIASAMGLDAEGTRTDILDRIRAARAAAKAA